MEENKLKEVNIKIEELNKEYNKYSQSIVKLLDISLKEGEVFVFTKLTNGSYGFILSREREGLLNIHREEGVTCINNILDILETKPLYL